MLQIIVLSCVLASYLLKNIPRNNKMCNFMHNKHASLLTRFQIICNTQPCSCNIGSYKWLAWYAYFDVHHFPMLHLNIHRCTFSCILEWGIHDLCIVINSFDLRCKDVTLLYVCDWICKNQSKSHKNWNPFYCLTLKLHSSTTQMYQIYG